MFAMANAGYHHWIGHFLQCCYHLQQIFGVILHSVTLTSIIQVRLLALAGCIFPYRDLWVRRKSQSVWLCYFIE